MEKTSLDRRLGLVSAISVTAGSVIGSGVFLVASDITRAVPSPMAALSVWLVAGLLSLLGGLTFAEMGAMYPGAGGQYVYLREAFGPLPSFLYGWTLFWVIQAGSVAAVAIAFAQYFSAFVPMGPTGVKLVGSAVIALLTVLNMRGVEKGAHLLDAVTGFKALALVAIAAAGFLLPAQSSLAGSWTVSAPAYGVALIAAFWAYDGWNNVTFVAGEIKEPQRNVPLALAIGLAGVTLLYLGANTAYFRMLSVEAIGASPFVAADAAQAMGGSFWARAMSALVLVSTFGCVNGMVLAGPRVTYAMAEDKRLPAWLAFVHPRFRVPTNALLAQMVWSILLVWSGRYDQLFTYVVSAAFIFYGLTGAGVLVLRRTRPDAERPYKVPLYPILPLAYVVFCAAFVANSFREKPMESLAGLAIVLLGVPVYKMYKTA
ncbi:MAG: amino acid permease [Elusimicrobia bacterium]|nr:amino acid permease [Elusimicrobiota bacterium]